MRFRAVSLLVICAALVAVLARMHNRGAFQGIDDAFVDWLVANNGGRLQEPAVTFVRCDDHQDRVFEGWPLTRLDYAVILKNLERHQANIVAIVPVLRWQTSDSVTESALKTQLLRIPQVLLGFVLEHDDLRDRQSPEGEVVLELVPAIEHIRGDVSRVPSFTSAVSLPEPQLRRGTRLGFTSFDLAPLENPTPGAGLRVPLLARAGETVLPSFVLQALAIQLDREISDVVVTLGDAIEFRNTPVRIPIDDAGYLAVSPGIANRIPRLDASLLLPTGSPDAGDTGSPSGEAANLATLRHNIVLLGEDHPGARQIPAGGGRRISRAGLLAMAIATVQSNRYFAPWPAALEYALWAGIVFAGLAMLRCPSRRVVLFSILLAMLYLIVSILVFQTNLRWISPVIPAALIGAVCLWCLIQPDRSNARRAHEK